MAEVSRDEERLAELMAAVTSGRADALVDAALVDAPPEVHEHLRQVRETFGALARALPPAAPSASLRDRILRSVAARPAPRRAVLVIDMLNDHLTPGRPLEVPRAREIVPALARRLDEARSANVPVVYVLDEHTPDDADLDIWGTHNMQGTPGAEVWPAIAPREGDRIVRKPTYSAFVRSDLQQVLEDLRVDTLVLTGCLTEVGILATATDALQRGFAVEVPPDAQAGSTVVNEQVAMGILRVLPPYGPSRHALLQRIHA
jgi:nicotinamidase-related amidase